MPDSVLSQPLFSLTLNRTVQLTAHNARVLVARAQRSLANLASFGRQAPVRKHRYGSVKLEHGGVGPLAPKDDADEGEGGTL